MNERIRVIRKQFNISQTEFGKRIGVSLGVIKNLEQGKTTLTSPLFELLCSIYHVNPDWLLNGEGEMFLPIDNSPLRDLQKQHNLSDNVVNIIEGFVRLPHDDQEQFIKTLRDIMRE